MTHNENVLQGEDLDNLFNACKTYWSVDTERMFITPFHYYRCDKCGWIGMEVEKFEDWPADEFYVKCPKCHAIDEHIQVCIDGKWEPAYVKHEPTPEEALRSELIYRRFASLMTANNVYRDIVIKKE